MGMAASLKVPPWPDMWEQSIRKVTKRGNFRVYNKCAPWYKSLHSAPADRGTGVLHAVGPRPLGTAEVGGSEKEGVAVAIAAGVARAADTRPEVR